MTTRNLVDPSWRLLAASGGDTVKLFDVSAGAESCDDPCVLSYTPTPRSAVNSVKWNHTNMVVASVGEDKKISLWQKNGKTLGTVSNDINEECLSAIGFRNKGSRFICTGGTGQTVRIWDLQKKICVKNLKGHTSTITGVMYNCKDEHVASISVGGDLIVHNLTTGAIASELKDPHGQILKVLDYSRFSRHLLLTAGDDGTVHLWDTTGRNPKMSWLNQHSAPTAGVCFSPSDDKIIASVGLDKKLYTYDSGTRKPSSCISYESPFSSLAFGDNGHILAAGTGNGRIVFYDVRGKPQPITVLHAYSSSEAVTSLSWQTSKPVIVNERNCTPEMALFGGIVEDSVVIPDPSPATTSLASQSTVLPGSHGVATSAFNLSSSEETPKSNHLRLGGPPIMLQAHRASDSSKDDMGIFSPVYGVQSVEKWSDTEGLRRDGLVLDKKASSSTFPSSSRGGFPFRDDGNKDWKQSSTSKQDDSRASFSPFGSTPTTSSKSEFPALTPPEAWGGEKFSRLAGKDKISEKLSHLNPPLRHEVSTSSASTSGSVYSGSRDFPSWLGQKQTSLANVSTSSEFPGVRDFNSNAFERSSTLADNFPSSPLLNREVAAPGNIDSLRLSPSSTRRFSTYAERIRDLSSGSPKIKKTGGETREEVPNNLLQRPEKLAAADAGGLPVMNGGGGGGGSLQQSKQPENNFTLQLFQRTLEGTLDNLKNSVHDDMRNLHIEILRQFHMHEMEMSTALNSVLENQAELMKEIKMLRKENQQLRQML